MIRQAFIVFILLACQFCFANPLDYRVQGRFVSHSYSIDQGLSQSVVNQSVEDSLGFLWFATEDGLNRFDGYSFSKYYHHHDDPNSLPDNYTSALAPATDGDLWLGTASGFALYRHASDDFLVYKNSKDPIGWVNALQRWHLSSVLIGSGNGLFIATQHVSAGSHPELKIDKLLDTEITDLLMEGDKAYALSSNCLFEVELLTKNIKSYCLKQSMVEYELKKMTRVGDILWLGTAQGIIQFQLASKEYKQAPNFIHQKLVGKSIQSLSSKADDIWVGTSTGLFLIKIKDKFINHFDSLNEKAGYKKSADIMSIYADSQNNIWLGVYGKGLISFSSRQLAFQHLLSESALSKDIATNTIHGVVKDANENLWFASYGAELINIDLLTGVTKNFSVTSGPGKEMLYSLFLNDNNELWIGRNNGLSVFDVKKKTLLNYKVIFGHSDVASPFIFHIYRDRFGEIWLATDEGLFLYNRKLSGNNQLYFDDYSRFLPVSFRERSNMITSILQDTSGNYWVGGYGGLLVGTFDAVSWSQFNYEAGNPNSLTSDSIQVIFQDHAGTVWVGTENGLNRSITNKKNVSFERITTRQGLPNNAIYGIQEDKNNYLWLSTNAGLVRYSQIKNQMQVFDHKDGVSSNELNTESSTVGYWGLLYFGSIDGVTQISPERLRNLEQIKKMRLLSFTKNDEKVPFNLARDNNFSVLEDETISIRVANLDYFLGSSQRYRYKIEGLSDEWHLLGNNAYFSIRGIPPGEYLLRIESKAASGQWKDNELKLVLHSKAVFLSNRNLFFLTVIIALFILVATVWGQRIYYRRLMQKREYQVKLENLRLRELRVDNERLKSELTKKGGMLAETTSKLNNLEQRIANQSFRDVVTNLMKVEYLEQLQESDKNFDMQWKEYNFCAILNICDCRNVEMRHGLLASNDFQQQIAVELKRHLPAEAHIFVIATGSFLILSRAKEMNYLVEELAHLRTRILSSQYILANGIVVKSEVDLNILQMPIIPSVIDYTINSVIEFLIKIGAYLKSEGHLRGTRIAILNRAFEERYSKLTSDGIREMIKSGELDVSGH